MNLRCLACDHGWQLTWDADRLAALCCPACGQAALPRASEDFAAALEDALSQVHWLSQAFEVQLTLCSKQLPAAFAPGDPVATVAGGGDL